MISQPPRLTACIALESFPVYNNNSRSEEEYLKRTYFSCDQNLEVTTILSSVNILYLYVKLFFIYFLKIASFSSSSSIDIRPLDTGNESGTEIQSRDLYKFSHLMLSAFSFPLLQMFCSHEFSQTPFAEVRIVQVSFLVTKRMKLAMWKLWRATSSTKFLLQIWVHGHQ